MSAKAGEIARENGIYRCEECEQRMPVRNGTPIEECPHCGSASFFTGLIGQPRPAELAFDGLG